MANRRRLPHLKPIYCCACLRLTSARLTSGREIYPHLPELAHLPFWKCDACLNFVGCHHRTRNRTKPLGCIPTPELKAARRHIHALIDPLWKSRRIERDEVYRRISKELGYTYHTAQLRTVEEARVVYRIGLRLRKELE